MTLHRADSDGLKPGPITEISTSGIWWCFPWGKLSVLLHVAAIACLIIVKTGVSLIGTNYAFDAMSWVQIGTPIVASLAINFGFGWMAFRGRRLLVTDESVTLVLKSGREKVFRYADFRTMAYPDQVFRNVPWAYIKMDIAFQLLAPPHHVRVLSGGGFAPAEMDALARQIRAIRPLPAFIVGPRRRWLFGRDQLWIDRSDDDART